MRIETLFRKDIFRPINGVVKADQLDEASVWQELDEFVVTRELTSRLRQFIAHYLEVMDHPNDPAINDKIGVWVSGFFGSGKSHFIKVLSYLLDNEPHRHGDDTRRAVDFFERKIEDAMLFGDIKRAVSSDTDVILFNIDSQADNRAGRDAILAVFLKMLNKLQGYSGDHPHIAHMERYLAGKDKLQTFKDTYRELTGTDWIDERDAYEFNRDQVIEALSRTIGQSETSCEQWIDNAESHFALTVENFAKWVKAYLDSRGPKHRLVFLVDEVGQFIGTDTHLMLNLQTISEELGTVCGGRAWIIVTSQEDIDKVLGDIPAGRANDFSKIQARFKTRLSLSSSNVDEVIQERLLAKRDDCLPPLETVFRDKGDILKNQLSFRNVGMTFKTYADATDFARNYPFAPYQFKLLQRIFESIRKAGATGMHLAQGERSLLDAFQSAAKAVAHEGVGVLVPLYRFYPAIESFLDTSVKRTVDHAQDNPSLEPFDAELLEVLFLIRYVEEIKGNVDNLVTLCLDQIDADRLALRRQIEASLQRLEKETLISRSGENYFFLTNEERDITREIKNVELSSGEEAKLLGDLIFADVFKDQKKHRFTANKMDFSFNRICDQHLLGSRTEGALTVAVITPLVDDYALYADSRCILDSSQDGGQLLIVLHDRESLGRELRALLKTDKYLRTRDDGTLAQQTRRIHRELAEDNRTRREQLVHQLTELLAEARYYAAGQRIEPQATHPQAMLSEALDYLVRNTFTKMNYLKLLCENPQKEIQALIRIDDVGQYNLDMQGEEANPQALDDLRQYIELCQRTDRPMLLHDLVTSRYANRPYGWPELETVLLLARLYAKAAIQFMSLGDLIPRERLYEELTTPARWRKVTLLPRASVSAESLRKARQLGKDVFAEMGPNEEDALSGFLRGKLTDWQNSLRQFRTLADTGQYPGGQDIADGESLLKALLAVDPNDQFFTRFLERKDDLLDLSDNYHQLDHFFEHQRPVWDKLRAAVGRFNLNRLELERHEAAATALRRMGEILAAPHPYPLIHEAEGLIRTVGDIDSRLVAEQRAAALTAIDGQLHAVRAELDKLADASSLRSACCGSLERLRQQTETQESLAHLTQAVQEAQRLSDDALARMEAFVREQNARKVGEKPVQPAPKPRRLVEPAKLLASGVYLETQQEVDAYLDALRRILQDALDKQERIQIR